MGAMTALLVLAALLTSMDKELPNVSYFKYIDLWFTWYIVNIFLVIVTHVAVDVIMFAQEMNGTSVKIQVKMVGGKVGETDRRRYEFLVNKVAKIVFPVILVLFHIVYLSLTL